jgi:hypothetical protein
MIEEKQEKQKSANGLHHIQNNCVYFYFCYYINKKKSTIIIKYNGDRKMFPPLSMRREEKGELLMKKE